ncbi:hypothetical protein M427DRAFT_65193, partial [Gonapodya prolifera JEL478]
MGPTRHGERPAKRRKVEKGAQTKEDDHGGHKAAQLKDDEEEIRKMYAAQVPRDERLWLDALESKDEKNVLQGLESMSDTLGALYDTIQRDHGTLKAPGEMDSEIRDMSDVLEGDNVLRFYMYRAYTENRPAAEDLTPLVGDLGEVWVAVDGNERVSDLTPSNCVVVVKGASSLHFAPLLKTLAYLTHLSNALGPRRLFVQLVRYLSQRVADFVDLLAPKADHATATGALLILKALAERGGHMVGRTIASLLSADVLIRLLGGSTLGAANRGAKSRDVGSKQSSSRLRKPAVLLTMALVTSSDLQVKSIIFGKKGVIPAIVKGLQSDSVELAVQVLRGLEVLLRPDARLTQTVLVGVFDHQLLSAIHHVAAGPSSDARTLAAYELLTALSTRPGRGICFHSDGLCLNPQDKVYNPILAGFLKAMPLVGADRDRDLLVGILGESQELIERCVAELREHYASRVLTPWVSFWGSAAAASLSLDPQVSPSWLQSMALIVRLVQLPVTLGSRIPAMSSLVANTCPPALTRNFMVRGLVHADAAVRFVMAEAIRVVIDKAKTVATKLRDRHASETLTEYLALCARFVPDLQTFFASTKLCHRAAIAPGATDDLKHAHAASLRCLAGYVALFGESAAGKLKADVGRVLGSIDLRGGGEGDNATVEAAMEVVIAGGWVKVEGTLDSNGHSQLHPFLQLLVTAPVGTPLRDRIARGLNSIVCRSFPFDMFPEEAPCLFSALVESAQRHAEMQAALVAFVDSLVVELAANPYRSIDLVQEIIGRQADNLHNIGKASNDVARSSPLMCLAVQRAATVVQQHSESASAIACFVRLLIIDIVDRTYASTRIVSKVLTSIRREDASWPTTLAKEIDAAQVYSKKFPNTLVDGVHVRKQAGSTLRELLRTKQAADVIRHGETYGHSFAFFKNLVAAADAVTSSTAKSTLVEMIGSSQDDKLLLSITVFCLKLLAATAKSLPKELLRVGVAEAASRFT